MSHIDLTYFGSEFLTPLTPRQTRPCDVHLFAPPHACTRQRSPSRPRLCPQPPGPVFPKRVCHEPRRDGAHPKIVYEQVKGNQDAYWSREPWQRQSWSDDFNCERCAPSELAQSAEEGDVQKQAAPMESKTTPSVTKRGPAAPVSLSPRRSTARKHRKTCCAQSIRQHKMALEGLRRIETKVQQCWSC